jgi:hypothetical protein
MELDFWLLSSDTSTLLVYLRYLFHPRHPPTACISLEGRAFLVVVTFVVGPAGGFASASPGMHLSLLPQSSHRGR